MKLDAERLGPNLARSLEPVYLISGDEPLLAGEAADAIRERARGEGYTERDVLFVEAGFDWGRLIADSRNLSLFADKKILELRLRSGKPGNEGSRHLVEYVENPPEGVVLLITTGKLERAQLSSKWVKALEKKAVHVQVRPIAPERLPAWITGRMRERGLEVRGDAARLLADRVEGNLLAANQEIRKLELLAGDGPVDGHAVREAVADSARFDVFRMVDAALEGNTRRALRIIDGLKAEGTATAIILWAMARETRILVMIAYHMNHGEGLDSAVGKARGAWFNRKRLYASVLRRHNQRSLHAVLLACHDADLAIKGGQPGNVWPILIDLLMLLTGRDVASRDTKDIA